MAKQVGLKCTILGESECERLGLTAFLSVGAASNIESKLIHLVYTGESASSPSSPPKVIAFVGKGLTFDSGGYNLKAGAGSMIEMMKFGGWMYV